MEREYACIDVILWTNYWEEANKIPGHAHSMELDESTVKGELGDDYYYYFSDGAINAFCVLGTIEGEAVEPCFPGSKFGGVQFSSNLTSGDIDVIMMKSMAEMVAALGEVNQFAKAGGNEMNEKDIQGTAVDVKVTDFTEYNNLVAEKNNLVAEKITLEASITALEEEKAGLATSLEDANAKVAEYEALEAEVAELREFKQSVITKEKEDLIAEFTGKVGDTDLAEIKAQMGEFETSALQEKLFAKAYVFSLNNPPAPPVTENKDETDDITKVIGTTFSAKDKESVPPGDTDIIAEIDALLK